MLDWGEVTLIPLCILHGAQYKRPSSKSSCPSSSQRPRTPRPLAAPGSAQQRTCPVLHGESAVLWHPV